MYFAQCPAKIFSDDVNRYAVVVRAAEKTAWQMFHRCMKLSYVPKMAQNLI